MWACTTFRIRDCVYSFSAPWPLARALLNSLQRYAILATLPNIRGAQHTKMVAFLEENEMGIENQYVTAVHLSVVRHHVSHCPASHCPIKVVANRQTGCLLLNIIYIIYII